MYIFIILVSSHISIYGCFWVQEWISLIIWYIRDVQYASGNNDIRLHLWQWCNTKLYEIWSILAVERFIDERFSVENDGRLYASSCNNKTNK